MAAFYKFLKENRNVTEDQIKRLQDDGIDETNVHYMQDDELSTYLPRRGDRISAINFHKLNKEHPTLPTLHQQSPTASQRKPSLIERLREKFANKPTPEESDHNPSSKSKSILPTNSTKATRVIEIGWMHFDEVTESYKQVRTKTGGGTRNITIDKSGKKPDILQKCYQKFFPGGKSSKGSLERMDTGLCDFQLQEIMDDYSVGDFYQESGCRTLRFYLKTKLKRETPRKRKQSEKEAFTKIKQVKQDDSSNDSVDPLVDFPFRPVYNDGEVSFKPAIEADQVIVLDDEMDLEFDFM